MFGRSWGLPYTGTGAFFVTSVSARSRGGWLLAATPVMVLLAHDVAVVPHEFAHSSMAWILGIKDQPGSIDAVVPFAARG